MSKIVYLIQQPLDEWNYERFGIQNWIDRGWDVEVWDLTPLVHPRVWLNFIGSERKCKEFESYFPMAMKSQIEHRFSKLGKIGYFIDLTPDYYYSIRVKMRLVQMGAIRVVCTIGSIPEPDDGQKCGFVYKAGKAIAKGPVGSFKWLINAIVRKVTVPFTKPSLIVVSGEKSIRSTGNNHKILKAHNLDYDVFLKLIGPKSIATREYGVFIDQDLCFHLDNIYMDVQPPVTPEEYFPTICNGIRKISDALDVNMLVAAHSRTPYRQKNLDYFEGIPVKYGKTAELISNCKFVVCHFSTAIQFAVLFTKPIIFVTTDELLASPKSKYIAKFATILGKSTINLDDNLDSVNWQREMYIDSQKYVEYKNKYIKISGSPEIPYWDIVINHITGEQKVSSY